MKKVFTIILVTLFKIGGVIAQAPQAIKYQAIARDISGNILASQNVSFRISILQGSASGPSMYTETQTATTNQFGLANLNIGTGTVVSGNFSTIGWGSNTYFVQMEFDPAGGSNYSLMGTSQFLSVPYSLYSETTGDTSMWKRNGIGIYYNGPVGIGTKNPVNYLHIQDTVGTGGVSAIIQGRILTGLYLRTHDTLNAPYKSWVLENQTEAINGNRFALFNEGNYPLIVKAGSPTNSLVIDSGKVGIGINTPQQHFHVYESSGRWETAELETNQANTALLFGGINGTSYIGQYGSGFAIAASHPYWSYPHFYIDSIGRVGIGTNTSMGHKLNINGNGIGITGDLTPGISFYPSVGALHTGILFQTSDQLLMGASGGSTIFGMDLNAPSNTLKIDNNGYIRAENDFYETVVGKGVIIKSPNGNCWRITVGNTGTLTTTAITCP